MTYHSKGIMQKSFITFVGILCATVTKSFASAPQRWQFGFQPAASPAMEAIVSMHNFLLWIIAFIAVLVTCLLGYIVWRFRASRQPEPHIFYHHTGLEVCWTAFAVLIVAIIMVPSLRLLHKLEMPGEADMTVKVIGKQWFWTYEYPDKDLNPDNILSFDSLMLEDHELQPGQKRLLDVDKPLVIPVDATVRFLVTAADVIHSFAIPSLGIKKDAVPGRTNETWVRISQPGTYYGQCSELCGTKHGFMPIVIRAVSKEEYEAWHQQQKK